jgi:hypothetical protein
MLATAFVQRLLRPCGSKAARQVRQITPALFVDVSLQKKTPHWLSIANHLI